MQFLAIDIGSSSIKGAVVDRDTGRLLHEQRTAFPNAQTGQPPGFHEIAPNEVLTAVHDVLHDLLAHADNAVALLTCAQMGGVILIDAEAAEHGDIRPLSNYLSWRDQRTTLQDVNGSRSIDRLRLSWSDEIFESLGKELKPGSATTLLHWLAERKRLPSRAMPLSIGDFVVSSLCRAKPRMGRTQTIGLLNLKTDGWHDEAFRLAGFDSLCWPQIAGEDEVVGILCDDPRVACYAAIGDQQAALRGVDLRPDELSINVSTGSQVSQITNSFQPAQCQSRCWFGGKFLNTITHIPAGRSLNVLESLLTELPRRLGMDIGNSWDLIAELSESSNGGGLLCDLSFFESAMGSTGRIDGIQTDNLKVGNLFDAAFDFMAHSYKHCSERLRSGSSWNQIAISGGIVQRFPSLRKKLQSRFDLPFREIAEQEESILGLWKIANDVISNG
ncbi:MAG: sedoheptulokinase [Planctomycetota bacterium]